MDEISRTSDCTETPTSWPSGVLALRVCVRWLVLLLSNMQRQCARLSTAHDIQISVRDTHDAQVQLKYSLLIVVLYTRYTLLQMLTARPDIYAIVYASMLKTNHSKREPPVDASTTIGPYKRRRYACRC